MKARWIILVFLATFGGVTTISGQVTEISERNTRYLDSIRQAVETYFCQNHLIYPEGYDKREINKVILTLTLFNFFVENDVAATQVDSAVSKINFGKVDEYSDFNGLLQTITVKVVLKYLSATIKFVYIDRLPITKKIALTPETTVTCSDYGNKLPDFKILTGIYGRYMDYPIRLVDLSYLLMKKFNPDNLAKASANHKEYKCFSDYLSDSARDWVYGLFLKQYDPDSSCCYSYITGEEDLIRLIKEERYSVIRDLVFSPNYFYAINAMEAVLYLSGTGKLPLDDELKERINELKDKDYKIYVRHAPDVLSRENGYKLIHIPDEAAIRKYQHPIQ